MSAHRPEEPELYDHSRHDAESGIPCPAIGNASGQSLEKPSVVFTQYTASLPICLFDQSQRFVLARLSGRFVFYAVLHEQLHNLRPSNDFVQRLEDWRQSCRKLVVSELQIQSHQSCDLTRRHFDAI